MMEIYSFIILIRVLSQTVLYNEADDKDSPGERSFSLLLHACIASFPALMKVSCMTNLLLQHAEMDKSRLTLLSQIRTLSFASALPSILGPGFATKGVCNMGLADQVHMFTQPQEVSPSRFTSSGVSHIETARSTVSGWA
jgi:hypothetical protein